MGYLPSTVLMSDGLIGACSVHGPHTTDEGTGQVYKAATLSTPCSAFSEARLSEVQ